MYRPLFTIPVLVATALLVLHSWLFRGPRATLLFWGFGYVVAFARELTYQNVFATYRFTGAGLQLLHVPVTIPCGWLFEAYVSLYVAQWVLGVDRASLLGDEPHISPRAYGARVVPLLGFACVVTATITLAIETVAVRMGWWQTRGGGSGLSPGWIHGHIFTVYWLSTLLTFVTHPRLRLWRNLAFVVAAWMCMFAIELAEPALSSGRTAAHVALALAAAPYVLGSLMWPQLALLALGGFVVLVQGDVPTRLLARTIGRPEDQQGLWLLWNVAAVLAYGVYLYRTQRPPVPRRPALLL